MQIAKTVEGEFDEPGGGGGLIAIAVRLAEAGQFSEALEITNLIKDELHKVLAMTNIADQYIRMGHKAKALET